MSRNRRSYIRSRSCRPASALASEFQRREPRIACQMLRRDLIGGDAVMDVGARGLRGWTPVSHAAADRAWSPGPSPEREGVVLARPVKMDISFRTLASGSRRYGRSNPAPSAAGVHCGMLMPFGTNPKARRTGAGLAIEASARTGSIDSSSGRAIAAPTPLMNVRLGICIFSV